VAGGVATLVAALVYAGTRGGATGPSDDEFFEDFGPTEVVGATPVADRDLVETPLPGGGNPMGGMMIGGGEPNATVIMRHEGVVPGIIAWLTHLTDPHRGSEIPLGRDARIGRDAACEIVIDDPEVSGWHARLQFSDGDGFVLRDVGSTNGTYVNGQKVDVVSLSDHDTIRVGNTELEFFWVRQQPDVPGELAYRASVLLQTGTQRGDSVSLSQDKILVGSSQRCDIVLDDEGVAGVHAVLSRDGNGYVLSTLGDAAVRVNGRSVEEQALTDRDEIVLGKARLLYRDGIDR
jgi:pSer/pThr/pTyr-binding forkhead associated (FHA) protein